MREELSPGDQPSPLVEQRGGTQSTRESLAVILSVILSTTLVFVVIPAMVLLVARMLIRGI